MPACRSEVTEETDKSFGAESSPAAKNCLKLKGSLEKDSLQNYVLYIDRLEIRARSLRGKKGFLEDSDICCWSVVKITFNLLDKKDRFWEIILTAHF